jgi:hypothetical protein
MQQRKRAADTYKRKRFAAAHLEILRGEYLSIGGSGQPNKINKKFGARKGELPDPAKEKGRGSQTQVHPLVSICHSLIKEEQEIVVNMRKKKTK